MILISRIRAIYCTFKYITIPDKLKERRLFYLNSKKTLHCTVTNNTSCFQAIAIQQLNDKNICGMASKAAIFF